MTVCCILSDIWFAAEWLPTTCARSFVFIWGVLVCTCFVLMFLVEHRYFYGANKALWMGLTREREGKDSSTYMWTQARTHAGQSGVFFSLRDVFFFFFSSGVACIREHLAEMCSERESSLFCFPVLLACLFAGEQMDACIMGQDGTCTHALLPH